MRSTTIAPVLLAVALVTALSATLGSSRALADNGNGTGAESISVTIPWSGTLTCTMHGKGLGRKPTVHRGNKVHCTATRFNSGEPVTVTVQSAPRNLGTVTANSAGTVVYDFAVPGDLADGAHTLTFTGETSAAVATYAFTVATGSGSGGVGAGEDASGSGSGVALTGVQILSMLAAALVLVGGGGLLVAAGRRREQRKHA
jgi:hypothetical protein